VLAPVITMIFAMVFPSFAPSRAYRVLSAALT